MTRFTSGTIFSIKLRFNLDKMFSILSKNIFILNGRKDISYVNLRQQFKVAIFLEHIILYLTYFLYFSLVY